MPDRLCQTEPVEHRHVQVEQDDVMRRFPPLYQGGCAVLCGFRRQTEKFKLAQDHFEVDGMIVDDQQARRGCPGENGGGSLSPPTPAGSCWPRFAEAQMNGEPSALA